MPMSKDESIVTQVAAKIAADLVNPAADINTKLGEWAVGFSTVKDTMLTEIMGETSTPAPAPAAAPAPQEVLATVQDIFPSAVPAHIPDITPSQMGIRIAGKVHGEVPSWLASEAAKKGITSVWDERDKLATNPKRPWFRSCDNKDLCLWPPRG